MDEDGNKWMNRAAKAEQALEEEREARVAAESALRTAREALGDLIHAAKDVIYNLPDGEYAGLGNLRSTVKQTEKVIALALKSGESTEKA